MKTLCLSLLLAVLASIPFESSLAGTPAASATTLRPTDHDLFAGAYKFKRKKRKKSRGPLKHKRHGLFGSGR